MSDDAWSQLVHLTDINAPDIFINKETFVIGRSSDGCDLSHAGNKLVSGKHCYIERDGDGKVWLYDTSTNGTLLNLSTKITKGECRQLNHGDEIYIIYKKDEPEQNIGYMFQDKSILDQAGDGESDSEEDSTQDYTQEFDQTLADTHVNDVPSPDPSPPRKSPAEKTKDNNKEEGPTPHKCKKLDEEANRKNPTNVTDDKIQKEIGKKDKEDDKKDKEDVKMDKEDVNKEKAQEPEDASIMESLICIICQEILHDCISLQPCMHSFCAGCYSEWMEMSNECPSCRSKVDRINKNHLVNNLVEAFLKGKPGFRRSEDDLKELDAKNKITRDMLYPGNTRDRDITGSDYSDDDEEEDDGEDANTNNVNNIANAAGGFLFGIGTPVFGVARTPNVVCRQCPGFYNSPTVRSLPTGTHIFSATNTYLRTTLTGFAIASTNNSQATPGPGPSTSGAAQQQQQQDDKVLPENPPDFTCGVIQNHVLCLCCMQPMPDRRTELRGNINGPQQQCYVCYRAFCHDYWGCIKMDCMGCLGQFREMNFGKKSLAGLILDNAYESEIFKNYLEDNGISVKHVLADCVAKFGSGDYTFQNQMQFHHGLNTPVCYACGLRAFKDLAYQYRKDIDPNKLPGEVTRRPNCYWGRNCRTQRNKPEHAQRFNHICEQTRSL